MLRFSEEWILSILSGIAAEHKRRNFPSMRRGIGAADIGDNFPRTVGLLLPCGEIAALLDPGLAVVADEANLVASDRVAYVTLPEKLRFGGFPCDLESRQLELFRHAGANLVETYEGLRG